MPSQITEAKVTSIVNSVGKKRKSDFFFSPYIRINPKWIRKLNVQNKTLQVMEENTGEFLCNVGIGKDFLAMTQNSDTTNKKVTNWLHIYT